MKRSWGQVATNPRPSLTLPGQCNHVAFLGAQASDISRRQILSIFLDSTRDRRPMLTPLHAPPPAAGKVEATRTKRTNARSTYSLQAPATHYSTTLNAHHIYFVLVSYCIVLQGQSEWELFFGGGGGGGVFSRTIWARCKRQHARTWSCLRRDVRKGLDPPMQR